MTLIGILAILLLVGTISSQSYVKKASAQTNKEEEQARTAPTNNTLSWFDKEIEKAEKTTASEAEKSKSNAAEKPSTTLSRYANPEVWAKSRPEVPKSLVEHERHSGGKPIIPWKYVSVGKNGVASDSHRVRVDSCHTVHFGQPKVTVIPRGAYYGEEGFIDNPDFLI